MVEVVFQTQSVVCKLEGKKTRFTCIIAKCEKVLLIKHSKIIIIASYLQCQFYIRGPKRIALFNLFSVEKKYSQ